MGRKHTHVSSLGWELQSANKRQTEEESSPRAEISLSRREISLENTTENMNEAVGPHLWDLSPHSLPLGTAEES